MAHILAMEFRLSGPSRLKVELRELPTVTGLAEAMVATVCHHTVRSKRCLWNKTALAMIFKLAEAAERSWRRLDGHNQLPKIILGVRFADGIEVVRSQAQAAAA